MTEKVKDILRQYSIGSDGEVVEEIDRDITFTVDGDSTELHLLRNDMKVKYYWSMATEWERQTLPRDFSI